MGVYKAEYKLSGAVPEKTPQQRRELSSLQLLQLQDVRRINNQEPLDPKLYIQNYEYDYSSFFARPIFTEEQKLERSNMVSEIKNMGSSWGVLQ